MVIVEKKTLCVDITQIRVPWSDIWEGILRKVAYPSMLIFLVTKLSGLDPIVKVTQVWKACSSSMTYVLCHILIALLKTFHLLKFTFLKMS